MSICNIISVVTVCCCVWQGWTMSVMMTSYHTLQPHKILFSTSCLINFSHRSQRMMVCYFAWICYHCMCLNFISLFCACVCMEICIYVQVRTYTYTYVCKSVKFITCTYMDMCYMHIYAQRLYMIYASYVIV